MLYVTTKNAGETHTTYKTTISDIGVDGGCFVPFSMPHYGTDDLVALKQNSFNEIVAQILNRFFSCRLTGEELDVIFGNNPFQLITMNHRIVVAELWHNVDSNLSFIIHKTNERITGNSDSANTPTEWVRLAVRIAVIFGAYGQMLRNEMVHIGQNIDFSVLNDDFTTPMAIWYCRKMGVPINMIVCTCDEDSNLWDFIHRGVFTPTATNKKYFHGIERLISGVFGVEEVKKFNDCCEKGKVYSVDEEHLPKLNQGLFCAVAGKNRAETTINSIYRANSYIADPGTALAYGGLQDYRASTGGSSLTVLLSEQTPLNFKAEISAATGIKAEKLAEYIKRN